MARFSSVNEIAPESKLSSKPTPREILIFAIVEDGLGIGKLLQNKDKNPRLEHIMPLLRKAKVLLDSGVYGTLKAKPEQAIVTIAERSSLIQEFLVAVRDLVLGEVEYQNKLGRNNSKSMKMSFKMSKSSMASKPTTISAKVTPSIDVLQTISASILTVFQATDYCYPVKTPSPPPDSADSTQRIALKLTEIEESIAEWHTDVLKRIKASDESLGLDGNEALATVHSERAARSARRQNRQLVLKLFDNPKFKNSNHKPPEIISNLFDFLNYAHTCRDYLVITRRASRITPLLYSQDEVISLPIMLDYYRERGSTLARRLCEMPNHFNRIMRTYCKLFKDKDKDWAHLEFRCSDRKLLSALSVFLTAPDDMVIKLQAIRLVSVGDKVEDVLPRDLFKREIPDSLSDFYECDMLGVEAQLLFFSAGLYKGYSITLESLR